MKYAGTITDWAGKVHHINSLDDLKQYNQYLIKSLEDKTLSYKQYDAEFNKALIVTKHNYNVDMTAGGRIDSTPYKENVGLLAVLHATNNARAILGKTGKLTGVLPAYGNGGGIVATNGGTGVNEGVIDAIGTEMIAYQDSTIVNDGTLFVWDNNDKYALQAEGMVAGSNGSSAINNGVINIRPFKNAFAPEGINTAIVVSNGGMATNKGTINITADASTNDNNGKTRGVNVGAGGSFINSAFGSINVGIAEDKTATHSAVGSVAIEVQNGANKVVNEGTIFLGRGAQGNYGILAKDAGTVDVVNKGTITIDGHDSDAPALNVGMLANNSSGMKNSGIINVNGLNSTGLQVINAGQLNSDGTINVGGKGISSGFRNYGAWVEGAGSNVNVSGKISLAGTGAVGFLLKMAAV